MFQQHLKENEDIMYFFDWYSNYRKINNLDYPFNIEISPLEKKMKGKKNMEIFF